MGAAAGVVGVAAAVADAQTHRLPPATANLPRRQQMQDVVRKSVLPAKTAVEEIAVVTEIVDEDVVKAAKAVV